MNTFLASVGTAQLLVRHNNQLTHLADCKTLTESSLSFVNTAEEIRCGAGAKLHGRFSHSSGLSIELQDAMFDIDYLSATLGANDSVDGHSGLFYDYNYAIDDEGILTLSKTPVDIGGICGLKYAPVWVAAMNSCESDLDWKLIFPNDDGQYQVEDFTNEPLCVKYFVLMPHISAITVPATFNPKELVLLLTTQLYAGDSSNPSSGRPIGEVTIKIPRFQLDGTLDLAQAMASHTPVSLSGVALADPTMQCPSDLADSYGEIIDIRCEDKWYTGLEDIVYDPETQKLYGVFKNGSVVELTDDFEGITEWYNDEIKVLYQVEVPGFEQVI